MFMLDWLDDIALRCRTNANLNKGEARNAPARAVFFNRPSELRDRTFENQRHRASALNFVSAAIILWNTVFWTVPLITLVSKAALSVMSCSAIQPRPTGSISA